jgi:hypothetical protein
VEFVLGGLGFFFDLQAALSRPLGTEVHLRLMNSADLREYATDAIKFWEPWRIAYNLALATIVVIYFMASYPLSKIMLSLDFCLGLFLLAVIANIAYCAAYVVDIFAQASGFREVWQRYRWFLFAIGTTFAAIITRFAAMGMFRPAN